MATSDPFVSILHGTIHRVPHYIIAENLIEDFPFLSIMGHVHWSCPQFYPQIVHKLKGLYECLVLGHDLIEIVSMSNQESMFYSVETLKMYFPKPSWDIANVMIPLYPNDSLAVRDLLNEVQNPLVRRLQFCVRVVDDVTIQD